MRWSGGAVAVRHFTSRGGNWGGTNFPGVTISRLVQLHDVMFKVLPSKCAWGGHKGGQALFGGHGSPGPLRTATGALVATVIAD